MKNLNEELADFAQQMSQKAPEEMLQTMSSEIGKLVESGIAEKALGRGDQAPDFELQDSEGKWLSLDGLVQQGPVVISFNRGNWCPFCNIEFRHLQKSVEEIKSAGANLIVISPQLPEKSAQLKSQLGYDYPILYDQENSIAREFGIVFTLSEPLRTIHQAFEMNIPEHNGNESYQLPLPSTFVVDSNKTIIYSYSNANWMERAEPGEYLQRLNTINISP